MQRFLKISDLLYQVNATDNTSRRAWYYLQVDPDKLSKFKMKLLTGTLKLSDYGKVVASGFGETAPADVKERIEKVIQHYE